MNHIKYLVVSSFVVRGCSSVASPGLLTAVISTSCIRASVTVAVAPPVLVIAATIVACKTQQKDEISTDIY